MQRAAAASTCAAAFALRARVGFSASLSAPACGCRQRSATLRLANRPLHLGTTTATVQPVTPIPESPASAAAAPSASPSPSSGSSRLVQCVLGFLLGVSGVWCADWLLWWPEPLPLLSRIVAADPLILSEVGSAGSLRFSPLWTGNVRELQSCSVRLPLTGDRQQATVFARAVYRPTQGDWRVVYLQAAIGAQAQRHSLTVPAEHRLEAETGGATEAAGGRRVALALPANFDPQLLPPEAAARYEQFLAKHGLTELSPQQRD